MLSGGPDNPGGLENRAQRSHAAWHDNPQPAPLIPAPASPARMSRASPRPAGPARGQPAASQVSRRRGSWPPAADSWCRVQPRPDGSSGRVVAVKISAARR